MFVCVCVCVCVCCVMHLFVCEIHAYYYYYYYYYYYSNDDNQTTVDLHWRRGGSETEFWKTSRRATVAQCTGRPESRRITSVGLPGVRWRSPSGQRSAEAGTGQRSEDRRRNCRRGQHAGLRFQLPDDLLDSSSESGGLLLGQIAGRSIHRRRLRATNQI